MSRGYRSLISGVLLVLISTIATAKDDDVITIGSFPFPPLLHLSEDGSFSGTMGETVKRLCAEAKLNCQFRVAPLSRTYNELRNGKIDALITLDLDQFEECCIRSQWRSPWSAGLFSFLPELDIPTDAQSMLGKSLIVVSGMRSPYGFLPKLDQWSEDKRINLSVGWDITTATKMFVRHRAEFLWGGEDFKWYINKHKPGVEYNFKPLMHKDVVVWVRKGKSESLSRLDSALQRMKQQGLLNQKVLLNEQLMEEYYKEAVFDKKKFGY